MAFFKKLTKKVATDVKEVVAEEAGKTVEEVKECVKEKAIDILPYAAMFVGALILIAVAKKPTPVVVKVIVEHV